jgi:uncharacterized protein YjbJ (UPF0337 family)
MNSDQIKGKWHEVKGRAKSRWGKLTDDDLTQISGDTEAAVGRIQQRYGVAKEQAQREWDEFVRNCGDGTAAC